MTGSNGAVPEHAPDPGRLILARRKSWWRRLTRRGKVVLATSTVVSLISGCAGGLYLKLAGNINVETIQVVGQRPLASTTGQNILLLGSQTRDGQIGTTFGGRSKLGTDISHTALLLHLSGY